MMSYNQVLSTRVRTRTEVMNNLRKNPPCLLAEYILQRTMDLPKNCIIVIVGEGGSGKSVSGTRILEMLNPYLFMTNDTITAIKKRVAFDPKRFLEIVDNRDDPLLHSDIIIFDEPQVNYNSRDYMGSTNKLINKVLTTYRHRQLITIFCTPSISCIDKQARKLVNIFIEMDKMSIRKGTATGRVYEFKYSNYEDKVFFTKIKVFTPKFGLKYIKNITFNLVNKDILNVYRAVSNEFKRNVASTSSKKLDSITQEIGNNPALNETEKKVLEMKVHNKLTKTEIADKLGLPLTYVNKAYTSMRKKGIPVSRKGLFGITN